MNTNASRDRRRFVVRVDNGSIMFAMHAFSIWLYDSYDSRTGGIRVTAGVNFSDHECRAAVAIIRSELL